MGFTVRRAEDVRDQLPPAWVEFADIPGHRVHPKVVFAGDKPVAIGSMAHNILHPEPRYFRFKVDEDADLACLTRLLQELLANLGPDGERPVHFSESKSNERIAAWAASAGFLPLMHTKLGVLLAQGPRRTPSQTFRRLSDSDTPNVRRALAVFHSRIYREQHRWNPPAPMVPEMAERLFLDEFELIPEYLWYSVDEHDRPTGVVSLRRTSAPQVLELGWCGVLDGVDDSVYRALLDNAVSVVGDRAVNLEVDENQAFLQEYFRTLPVVWHKELVRYERQHPHPASEEPLLSLSRSLNRGVHDQGRIGQ